MATENPEKASPGNLNDPWWRICNIYTIEDEKGQLRAFKPNHCQRLFYFAIHWLNYVLKSRQLGFSTFIAIFILDRLLFESNKSAGVIDCTIDDAKKKLRKMRVAYEHLDNKELHPDTWHLGAVIKLKSTMTKGMDSEFPEVLVWSNSSMIYAGTSHRGSTLQYVWVSELGKIAHKSDDKANEILEGAFEAMHEGAIGFVETTHEGGRAGVAYNLCTRAMNETAQALADGVKLIRLQWKFHFFGFWQDPKNNISDEDTANLNVDSKLFPYFDKLRNDHGISLTTNQKAWYQLKWKGRESSVLKEHPATPEDAFQASVEGSIYGESITTARAGGRIRNFPVEPRVPVYTFWDLGRRDFCVILFIQFVGTDIRIVDGLQDQHKGADYYAKYCQRWERDNDIILAGNIIPHDGDYKNIARNESVKQVLESCGLRDVIVVPVRRHRIWDSIDHVRSMMHRMVFHADNLDKRPMIGTKEGPSIMSCFEAYHVPQNSNGADPVHDESSHACSALTTLAEADILGLIPNAMIADVSDRSPLAMAAITGFEDW